MAIGQEEKERRKEGTQMKIRAETDTHRRWRNVGNKTTKAKKGREI